MDFLHRLPRAAWFLRAAAVAAIAAGCGGGGPFEELHRLEPDGAGVSFFRAPGGGSEAAAALREGLSGPGLTVERVREEAGGSLLAEVRFDSVEALCAAPRLVRECSYRPAEGGGRELRMRVPAASGAAGGTIEVQPSARVLGGNSPERPRRGNRFRWRRPPGGGELEIRLATDERTVFSYALRTVARSAAIAAGTLGLALWWLVRIGRRRLRAR